MMWRTTCSCAFLLANIFEVVEITMSPSTTASSAQKPAHNEFKPSVEAAEAADAQSSDDSGEDEVAVAL